MPRSFVRTRLALGADAQRRPGGWSPPQGQAELRGTSSVSIHVRAASQDSRLLAPGGEPLATQISCKLPRRIGPDVGGRSQDAVHQGSHIRVGEQLQPELLRPEPVGAGAVAAQLLPETLAANAGPTDAAARVADHQGVGRDVVDDRAEELLPGFNFRHSPASSPTPG